MYMKMNLLTRNYKLKDLLSCEENWNKVKLK